MSTAVAPVAAGPTMQERLAERVKGFLVDVLSDEEIKVFCDQAVARFLHGWTAPGTDYHRTPVQHRPEIEGIVTGIVQEHLKAKVIAAVEKRLIPKIDETIPGDTIEAAAERLIQKLAPSLLQGISHALSESMISGLSYQVMERMRSTGMVR